MKTRVRKKLLEKETWYKKESKNKDWEMPQGWKHDNRGKKRKTTDDGQKRKPEKRKKVKGVMFITHTHTVVNWLEI